MVNMSKEAREVKNAYARAWRKNNPELVRAAQARYWEKKAREMLEKGRGNRQRDRPDL